MCQGLGRSWQPHGSGCVCLPALKKRLLKPSSTARVQSHESSSKGHAESRALGPPGRHIANGSVRCLTSSVQAQRLFGFSLCLNTQSGSPRWPLRPLQRAAPRPAEAAAARTKSSAGLSVWRWFHCTSCPGTVSKTTAQGAWLQRDAGRAF